MTPAPERQVQEERAPVVGEEISGARPIPEAPPEAIDLTDEVREGWDEMPSEAREFSRGLFGRLKEKLTSTEVVQNIADRYRVWRDSSLAEREQKGINKLAKIAEGGRKKEEELRAHASRVESEMKEVGPLLAELGIEFKQEERVGVLEEAERIKEQAEAEKGRVEQITGKMEDLRGKKENYESLVEGARGRLDGRLAEKQEINNQSLEKFRGNVAETDTALADKRTEAKDLDRKMVELRGAMKGIKSEIVRGLLGGKLAGLEAQRAELDAPIRALEKQKTKYEAEMKKFQAKNADLQKRRDTIIPSKERKPIVESTKEKPLQVNGDLRAFEDGGMLVADYNDGSQHMLGKDRFLNFKPDEESEDSWKPIDDLTDEEFEDFFREEDWTADELRTARISDQIIDRIERIREMKKMTAHEITGGWNRFAENRLGSKHGLSVKAEGDPDRQFSDKQAAKRFLLEALAKKVAADKTPRTLSRRAQGLVENYFDSRYNK